MVDNWDNGKIEIINKEREKELGAYYSLFVNMFCVPCDKCYQVLKRNKEKTVYFYLDSNYKVSFN